MLEFSCKLTFKGKSQINEPIANDEGIQHCKARPFPGVAKFSEGDFC
jgi:hypothetical protein